MSSRHRVYVISDLHMGGRIGGKDGASLFAQTVPLTNFVDRLASEASRGDGRVELVVNGDFLDFLAEPLSNGGRAAFRYDSSDALDVYRSFCSAADLVPIFDSLVALSRAGGCLTLLLGNHDLELAVPAVRRELERKFGTGPGLFRFLIDGEAHSIDDVLIEHGNRYDEVNRVDMDGLRRYRALASRGLSAGEAEFDPPSGSHVVAKALAFIEKDHPWVWTLKPETRALLPVLLALDPLVLRHLPRVVWETFNARLARLWRSGRDPIRKGEIAGTRGTAEDAVEFEREIEPHETLERVLQLLPIEDQGEYCEGLGLTDGDLRRGTEIARGGWGLLELKKRDERAYRARLVSLWRALRNLQKDVSFELDREGSRETLEGACGLVRETWNRVVVFGHTHLPKEVCREGSSSPFYYNSGTWADALRLPPGIVDTGPPQAIERLDVFLENLEAGKVQPERRRPVVRFEWQGNRRLRSGLHFLEEETFEDMERGDPSR